MNLLSYYMIYFEIPGSGEAIKGYQSLIDFYKLGNGYKTAKENDTPLQK
jgi:hypothetical protein